MTETAKSLPEIYRKAAELVLKTGKVEGDMKAFEGFEEDENRFCLGYCTMGAVFDVAGILTADGLFEDSQFIDSPEFLRLAGPVADQIVTSGRRKAAYDDGDANDIAFWTIAYWNDRKNSEGKRPTAEDVAALLRETADAVEVTAR